MTTATTHNAIEHLTHGQLAQIIGATVLSESDSTDRFDAPVGRVSCDSREAESDCTYWCLETDNRIATRYISEAISRGCRVIVTSGGTSYSHESALILQVADPHWALWQLARHNRQQFHGTMIAVTGSIGKSVAGSMIDHVLSTAMRGTYRTDLNAEVDVLLSMLELSPSDDYAVVELPLRSRSEILAHSDLCCPEIIAITSLTNSMLGGFDSETDLLRTLCELIQDNTKVRYVVTNGDDPLAQRLKTRRRDLIDLVGRNSQCSMTGSDVTWQHGRLDFFVAGRRTHIDNVGRHFLTPALIAVAVGQNLQMTTEETATAISGYRPLPARCEVLTAADVTVIDDSQDSRRTDAWAAVEMLRDYPAEGRRVAIVGDMADVGSTVSEDHRQLGDALVSLCGAELVIACGDYAKDIVAGCAAAGMRSERTVVCQDAAEVADSVTLMVQPDDTVLVKGCRRLNMKQIVDRLVEPSLMAGNR